MTKVQSAILEAVRENGQHLSAEQVFLQVKRQFPSVALGTVYRNLNRFADERLIRRVVRGDSADYFEGNTEPHDHVTCAVCGRMTDIRLPDLKDYLQAQINCEIVSFDLTVNCVCAQCEAENPGGEHPAE